MSPDTTVILSPHFDDAVLSCWHVLASAGEVLVVNVFAGEPPAGTLGWWDQLAGASDSAAVVRTRVEEDRRALARTGHATVNLPFLDGQYREGDQAPGEIVRALREVLVKDALIYAPASLGDTIATTPPCVRLHWRSTQRAPTWRCMPTFLTRRWTDGPRWVLNGGARTGADVASEAWATQLETTGLAVERMVAAVHRLGTDDHASKLEAVFTYGSQIAPLQKDFGSLADPQLLGLEVDWRLQLMT